ncbi:FAD/NAD(P)-binding domain-containing protein [Coniochaeta ligniaria NRRL 30616]|uniref:FAD/NAD(P)-binding domain-containing protein n=1 Tax=Coniochaeta ligniaria NRRL 30616 TaxID=1408157 RepID=A0A1J7IYM9_9PEZI|nr:FAD/NAD(P)-binding domain-containing protein [Coniochaeta ligniaria NRRL 30616]
MESLDLVVIGAGWFGLAAAKTYHQLHPDKSLAILEASSTPGGVWAKHRLYPGLKSNNMLGTYEYPDFPLDSETFGVKPGEHIPGTVLHDYLTKYAEKFGIMDKIGCNRKVTTAEHQEGAEGGWILTVQSTAEGASDEKKILARKLILATGLTSEAFLPDFKGQDTFGVPLFHTKDFKQHADTLESAKTVTVFGGTKSSFDAVYAYASKGIKVNWVIRETGHGPIWIAPPYVTPLKKWLEKLVHTRMLTWFSPCIWGEADGYVATRRFYHGSAVGRAITNAFWSVLGNDVLALNRYDAHPETRKLKPWSEAMFTASSFSILTYPTDIFELVREGTVKVHIADITHLSHRTVHLSDGAALETDAMVCATGWKHLPPLTFLPAGIDRDLGIPHTPSNEPLFTAEMVQRADEEILSRFPRLKQQPVQNKNLKPLLESDGVTTKDQINPSTPLTPYTLYRFMVPPTASLLAQRDIAFAGVLMNFSVPLMAHAQALWISAYFDGKLSASVIPRSLSDPTTVGNDEKEGKTVEELRYETVLHARFGKWRYPAGYGTRFPDFVFDALPYVDLLVGDLGLEIYRKGGGWVAEATQAYGPGDYRGLVEEWRGKHLV